MITLKKKYWGKTIKEDLLHLGLEITIEEIELMPKQTYKKLIRKKIEENAFEYLITKRNNRNGKGMKLSYKKFKIHNYLASEDIEITNTERKYIFQFRT